LLPKHNTFGDKIDENNAYAWWFAFHQVKGLPEDLLEVGLTSSTSGSTATF
jgi:hypothetical protein